MSRPTGETLAIVLGTGPQDGATVAALRLAEEAVQRGHRVAVYAYGEAAEVGCDGVATAPHVAALLHKGVHGGLASWVVDRASVDRQPTCRLAEGVVSGDGGDLWRFVRESDVVLGVSR